jgi:hypothetical protein
MERWQSWSIASDLKSDESHGSEGSNPSLSFYICIGRKVIFRIKFEYFYN